MNDWNATHETLPEDREYVQFAVAGHRDLVYGVYREHCFFSRLAAYLPREVSAWRKLGDAPQVPAPHRADARRRSWSQQPMRECANDMPAREQHQSA